LCAYPRRSLHLKAETSVQIGGLRFQINRPTLVVGFVQQTLGKNGADTLALSSIQKVAVSVRLLGTEPVERRLGAEKLHEAYGTDRNKARIMRQQTQDSGFGHRIAAGRIPDEHADDFMAARNHRGE